MSAKESTTHKLIKLTIMRAIVTLKKTQMKKWHYPCQGWQINV